MPDDYTKIIPLPYQQDPWAVPQYPYPGTGLAPTLFTLPPRFAVPNKKVAVEPFPESSKDRNRVKGGVLEPMNESALVKLKVVFGSPDFQEGQYVYVRANLPLKTTYGKEVFEADGRKFTLLPETEVLLVERYPDPASIAATITGSK